MVLYTVFIFFMQNFCYNRQLNRKNIGMCELTDYHFKS